MPVLLGCFFIFSDISMKDYRLVNFFWVPYRTQSYSPSFSVSRSLSRFLCRLRHKKRTGSVLTYHFQSLKRSGFWRPLSEQSRTVSGAVFLLSPSYLPFIPGFAGLFFISFGFLLFLFFVALFGILFSMRSIPIRVAFASPAMKL